MSDPVRLHQPVAAHAGQEADAHLREPPVNLEAEQALIGALLANNRALDRIGDFLRPEHFADAAHGRVYAACQKLIERGQNANAVTLKNYFEGDESLSDVGGAAYLAELQAASSTIINVLDYAQVVHDLHIRRELIAVGEDIVNEAHSHDIEVTAQNQIEQAESRLFSLAETGQSNRNFVSFGDALKRSIELTEQAMSRSSGVAGVACGFTELDKLLGGLHNSDLLIVAARPAMGKSSFAANIAAYVARTTKRVRQADGTHVDKQQPVALFSLEMSSEQIATRILSEMTQVSSDRMRRGQIKHEEFDRVFEASRHLGRLPLFLDDTPAISISALRTKARRLKRQQKGLSLIIVDYLQLMQAGGTRPSDSRVQEVSEITRGLKAIAKELDVPVMALSQLSRAPEQRDDKRPQLSDLRESGSIEQDADVVMFLFREEYYLAREKPVQRVNETSDKFVEREASYEERLAKAANLAEVIVAKQRHGPIATIELHFDGEFTRFSDLARSDDDYRQ